jgi:hypothetical protein
MGHAMVYDLIVPVSLYAERATEALWACGICGLVAIRKVSDLVRSHPAGKARSSRGARYVGTAWSVCSCWMVDALCVPSDVYAVDWRILRCPLHVMPFEVCAVDDRVLLAYGQL